MKHLICFFTVGLSLLSFPCFSQKQITLINGEVFMIQDIKIDSNWVTFSYEGVKGGLKNRTLSFEDVFSYHDGVKEQVFYGMQQDTTGIPTVAEMRMYIEGEKIGRATFKPTKHFIAGAVVGVASGIALNSGLFGLAIPPIYTLLTTVFPVHQRKFPITAMDGDEFYKAGRNRQYKRQRTGAALKSSAVGLVVGLIAGSLVANR